MVLYASTKICWTAAVRFLALLVQRINVSNLSAWLCLIPLSEAHWSLSTAGSCRYPSKTIFPSLSFLYKRRFSLPRLLALRFSPPLLALAPLLHSGAFALPFFLPPSWPSPLSILPPVVTVFGLLLSSVYLVLLFFPHSLSTRPLPLPAFGRIPASVSYSVPQHKGTPMIPFLYITMWFRARVTHKKTACWCPAPKYFCANAWYIYKNPEWC